MAQLVHELWAESSGEQTVCLAGPMGDDARARLESGARRVWTVEAGSHFEAMTKYYAHMGWGAYSTDEARDFEPYLEEWLQIQNGGMASAAALYYIDARDQPGLLWAVLRAVGESAHVALEGDLQNTGLLGLPHASFDETETLRRQTLVPRLDFVVLPTAIAVVTELKSRLSAPGLFGQGGALIHVQIEQRGDLVFIACDNFHESSTWLQLPQGHDLLQMLTESGIVRSFNA